MCVVRWQCHYERKFRVYANVELCRVDKAQEKQGIWIFIFPDRENTGNLQMKNMFPHKEKLKGCTWVVTECCYSILVFVPNFMVGEIIYSARLHQICDCSSKDISNSISHCPVALVKYRSMLFSYQQAQSKKPTERVVK